MLPVANVDDHAEREKRTNAMATRADKRRSPYLSYFSTLLAAIALGTSIGTAALSSLAQGAVTSNEVIHPAHVELTAVTVSAT